MEIRADLSLPFPRDRVFAAYRDRLADLTDYLPNIKSIRVASRTDLDGRVELVNEWVGGGEIPKALQAVLSESMLRWTDHATWHEATHDVDWRTDVHAFPGAVKCSGKNFFRDAGSGMRLEIRGELTCDASKIPGVPRLLARTIGGAAEKVLVGQISVNLLEVGKGVGKLLAKEG